MYNKIDQQSILELLQKINDKLDKLTEQNQQRPVINELAEIAQEIAPTAPEKHQQSAEKLVDHTVQNLTQVQYELSNELFSGIDCLKQLIKDGERYTITAKGKYQK